MRSRAWTWAAALGCLLALALLRPVFAAEIASMRLDRVSDGGVALSAQVRFELPAAAEDALQKGIPLFFVAEAVIQRDRWYWYDKELATATRHMRLSYHPLAQRWRLVVSSAPVGPSGAALGQGFDSREDALAAVQRISGWKLADAGEVDLGDPRITVSLRFRLDTSQLPRPFQIGTVGQSDWNLVASRSQRLGPEAAR